MVVCGLIMSQAGPRIGRAGQRRQTEAFWSLATFLLNGALFVLVGLELRAADRNLTSADLARALITVGAVSAVLVVVRFAFLCATIGCERQVLRVWTGRTVSGHIMI